MKKSWKYTYEQNILAIRDKNISDFNCRLLNNLLCNREMKKEGQLLKMPFVKM